MAIDLTLVKACRDHGTRISAVGLRVNGPALLWALAGVESSFGAQRLYARYEPAYAPGGIYFASPNMKALWGRYGAPAACSWGAFQIMYVVAWELGYRDAPWGLQDDDTCASYASKLIIDRFFGAQHLTRPEDIFDAYNTGTAKDRVIPVAYIMKAKGIYDQSLAEGLFS